MKPTARPDISLDLIRAADQSRIPPCTLSEFLKTLKPTEMAAVFAAMADHTIKGYAIHAVLAERGFKHDRQVVWRHRVKPCVRCRKLGLKVP